MDVEGGQKLGTVFALGYELAASLEYPHLDILDFATGIGGICPRKGGRNAVSLIACVVGVA